MERWVTATLAALGGVFLLLGAWAAVDASSFADVLADFGPLNAHLVHDFGAASGAIGAALVVAAWYPEWRLPVLGVAALWNGLHALSHLADLGDAASLALGVGEAALLIAATGVLLLLARRTRRSTGGDR